MEEFQSLGLEHVVLCPGSRSGPLALAAGHLAQNNLIKLHTSIDERSAAFLALGLATAKGTCSAVITTSGSAVANLLPAAIEADYSSKPLLFLTADRPSRLKNCGANQTVNQEEFLRPACRWVQQGPLEGIHLLNYRELNRLVATAWYYAQNKAGPVHINIPIEEPLHPVALQQDDVFAGWKPKNFALAPTWKVQGIDNYFEEDFVSLDPSKPGVIIVGPWRGNRQKLQSFQKALRTWHSICGWPLFLDPLSGVFCDHPGVIRNWDLILPDGLPLPKQDLQIMRLGPLPASRTLERWLRDVRGTQLLITEGDFRKLDPLGKAIQINMGLDIWLERFEANNSKLTRKIGIQTENLLSKWLENDNLAQDWLDDKLPPNGVVSEPSLARWLSRLLPAEFNIMLASSSPVRDWLSFSDIGGYNREIVGFRGVSGIDGTLSLAMGIALGIGPTLLVTGDLALLHDSNGWLLSFPEKPPLLVLLIENGGGGIFSQLNIDSPNQESFQRLFSMPQHVDQQSLADAHYIPHRQVSCLEDLQFALEWGLAQTGPALLRVCTDSFQDAALRNEIRKSLGKLFAIISQNGLSN